MKQVKFKANKGCYNSFKLKNCLTIARLLSRRPHNIQWLHRELEVSERSILRYLQALDSAGFRLKKCEKKSWYQIDK